MKQIKLFAHYQTVRWMNKVR